MSFKQHTEYTIPEELQQKFNEILALKAVFEALTPGRQRGYMLFSLRPNNPKQGRRGLKNTYRKFLMGRE